MGTHEDPVANSGATGGMRDFPRITTKLFEPNIDVFKKKCLSCFLTRKKVVYFGTLTK